MKINTLSYLTVAAALAMLGVTASQATTTFTVTNTSPSGAGSLFDAITNANNTAGLDTIAFNVPSTDGGCHNVPGVGTVCTIQAGGLPAIIDPLTIDGYTQPGSSQNTLVVGDDAKILIELDGTGAISSGLYVIVDTVTIRGLVINRFSDRSIIPDRGNGVFVDAVGTVVEGCFIGTDPTGTTALPNGKDAVSFHGPGAGLGARVGGTTPAQRNILSGNVTGNGVGIFQQASGVQVLGNYIGTDRNGTAAVPNAGGINIDRNGATNQNQIGGPNPGEGNVISGNLNPDPHNPGAGYGVALAGGDGDDIVRGNYIGIGADGSTPVGNSEDGVVLGFKSNFAGFLIGGTDPGDGNIISSNGGNGISSSASTGNTIQGNLIGTAADGTTARGNTLNGIKISSFGNAVGGTTTGAGNVIAFNGMNGVSVPFAFTFPSSSNAILGNSIHDNGTTTSDLGIDLDDNGGGDGVSPNDNCDTDSGGSNELQNYPVLSSAVVSGGTTSIHGTLDSVSNTTYRIEFFSNSTCDASGYGEGETFLGATDVTTDANCSAIIDVTLPVAVTVGQFITATATDPSNNTSEFSACSQVVPAATVTASPLRVREGHNSTYTISLSANAPTNLRIRFLIGGTATLGEDYTLSGAQINGNLGRVTIPAGQSSATVTLHAITDGITEAIESATLTLRNGSGYGVSSPSRAIVRISDP